MRFGVVATTDGSRAVRREGERWLGLDAPDLSARLARTDPAQAPAGDEVAGDEVAGDLVLPLPRPAKVVCCGLNYAEHIRETGRERPTYPTLFAKYADTLVGPGDDVVLPADVQADWEAELAVVVGAPLRRADRATARRAIAGYTVANDVSVRDWQRRTLQWFQGKAWDATTPLGPVLVTPDEIEPADGLRITCRVNGETVQDDSTADLVFDSADLLAYVSTFTVLRPGDVVLTGTPGGVGVARDPQRFLADGDVLETEIEGIGTLTNRIRTEQ